MTLYEFKLLDKEKQYEVTFKKGTFIDYHLETKRRFALYAVDRFFVEVEYNPEDNSMENLKSFIEGDLLERYAKLK